MRSFICMMCAALALCSPCVSGARDANDAGYVFVSVANAGKDRWSIACLDMPHKLGRPPQARSYGVSLAGLWATMFPNSPLAVQPSLIDHPLNKVEPAIQSEKAVDAVVLFEKFVELCGASSLRLIPCMSLTPRSGVTQHNHIYSVELHPVVLLSAADPIEGSSWQDFTSAAAESFRLVAEKPHKAVHDEASAEQFWRDHFPQVLSQSSTKVVLSIYRPMDGILLYKCESNDYQGMGQSFLDFFTRP